MKPSLIVAAAALAASGQAAAQSLTDQKTQWEVAKLAADTEKARADTQKVRFETDQAVYGLIRGTTGGSATVTAGEKTAEALLLTKASLAGASSRLVTALGAAGVPPASDVAPLIVMGRTPPSVTQWLTFRRDRERTAKLLEKARRQYDEARGRKTEVTKMAVVPAAMAVAALVSTVVPMLKTDTTIAGGAVATDETDVRAALGVALDWAGYAPDAELRTSDGVEAAARLLQPLSSDHDYVQTAYDGLPRQDDTRPMRTAAATMREALLAYRALEAGLLVEAAGIMAASVVDRQRQRHEAPDKHPVIHILNADTAFTMTTKKGMFTGLDGSVPAFMSAATVLDYAIVVPDAQRSGSAGCTIAKRPVADLLAWDAAALFADAARLCVPSAGS